MLFRDPATLSYTLPRIVQHKPKPREFLQALLQQVSVLPFGNKSRKTHFCSTSGVFWMGFGRRHLAEMGVPLRGEVNHHRSLTSQNLKTPPSCGLTSSLQASHRVAHGWGWSLTQNEFLDLLEGPWLWAPSFLLGVGCCRTCRLSGQTWTAPWRKCFQPSSGCSCLCLSNVLSAVCGKANRKSSDMEINKSVLALATRTQFRRPFQISVPSEPTWPSGHRFKAKTPSPVPSFCCSGEPPSLKSSACLDSGGFGVSPWPLTSGHRPLTVVLRHRASYQILLVCSRSFFLNPNDTFGAWHRLISFSLSPCPTHLVSLTQPWETVWNCNGPLREVWHKQDDLRGNCVKIVLSKIRLFNIGDTTPTPTLVSILWE